MRGEDDEWRSDAEEWEAENEERGQQRGAQDAADHCHAPIRKRESSGPCPVADSAAFGLAPCHANRMPMGSLVDRSLTTVVAALVLNVVLLTLIFTG